MKRSTGWAVAFVAATFAPLLLASGHKIQQYDPAQYAEVARRMFESGNWAFLRDAFGPYLDKPPLTFWLINASFAIFGLTSFAVRAPALGLGIVLLVLIYQIGRLLWSSRTGWIAAGFAGSSVGFQIMVLDPKVDMAVTTFIACAVYFFLRASATLTLSRRQERGLLALGWTSVGLAMLSKGPIGLCAPLLAVLPEFLRKKDAGPRWFHRIAKLRPVSGLLIVGALLAPWYYENIRQFGTEGPLFLLWHQSFGRIFERTYRNDTSPFFFLHTGLWAFMPFVAIFIAELGRRFSAWRTNGWKLPPSTERIVLWWFLLPLIGISASSYKLPQYLYWLTPPAALLAARGLTRWAETDGTFALNRLARVQTAIAVAVIGLVAIMVQLCFPSGLPTSTFWITVSATAPILAWTYFRRIPPDWGVALLALIPSIAFNVFFDGYFHSKLLKYQPYEEIGRLARQLDPTGRVLPFDGVDATNSAAFYARRDVAQAELHDLSHLVREGYTRVAVVRPDVLPGFQSAGLIAERVWDGEVFPTSRPSRAFLVASTRSRAVTKLTLVKLSSSLPSVVSH